VGWAAGRPPLLCFHRLAISVNRLLRACRVVLVGCVDVSQNAYVVER
jgi:hypothetical protein